MKKSLLSLSQGSGLRVTLSLVFLTLLGVVYQNFSELKINPIDYPYTLVELTSLDSPRNQAMAYGVNSKGEVVGQSYGDDGLWHAVMWDASGKIHDLGVIEKSAHDALAHAISDEGFIVGELYSAKGKPKGFTLDGVNKKPKDCGKNACPLRLTSISNQFVIGSKLLQENGQNPSYQAALWNTQKPNEKPTLLGTLAGGLLSEARGLNKNQHIVGWSTTQGNANRHAFLWRQGQMIDLHPNPQDTSAALAINDLGMAVGEVIPFGQSGYPALWIHENEKTTAINLFSKMKAPALSGVAHAINNQGLVVGEMDNGKQKMAFLWDIKSGVKNLESLSVESDPAQPEAKWSLSIAKSISECGHIVGWGQHSVRGSQQPFLLKPVTLRPGC